MKSPIQHRSLEVSEVTTNSEIVSTSFQQIKMERRSVKNVASTSALLPPLVLATSHISTDAAAKFPTTQFAVVGSDGCSSTNDQNSSKALQVPTGRALSTPSISIPVDDHSTAEGKMFFHQANDDHIPIPPLFFPNPARHIPHHVHIPKHPIDELKPDLITITLPRRKTEEVRVDEEEVTEVTALHDLLAGGIAGSASVAVGHPFDTIKVRMQTGAGGASALKPSLATLKSLYRGMGPPFSAAGVVNALVFSGYGWSSRVWDGYHTSNENAIPTVTDTTSKVDAVAEFKLKNFVCGAFSGLLQTFVLCPTEHVKCRLQVQESSLVPSKTLYKGPSEAALQIYKSHGMFRGLFRGWTVTAWREVPAFGFYFSTYDYIKESTNSTLKAKYNVEQPWIASGLAGGLAGCFTWALVYPFDVIKTRIQTRSLDCRKGIWRTGKDIVVESGWKAMFRGLGVTLVRAFPVNGVIFPVYEFTLLKLTGGDRMVD